MVASDYPSPNGCPRAARHRASTLVEVMMAGAVLSVIATALVGIFLQNQRFSYVLSYRTQAVTSSLSILEQLRFRQYAEMADVFNAGSSGSVTVQLPDPTTSSGYRSLTIPVNVRNGVLVNSNWTSTNLAVSPDSRAPLLPMKFFLTLKRNYAAAGNKIDVFEVVLLYQWQGNGESASAWQTGNVRLVIPNLNPLA